MRKRDGVARRHERRFIISIRVARLQSTTFFISARNSESANSIYHLGINVFKRKFARDVRRQKNEEKRRVARTGSRNLVEKRKLNREKNSSARERGKEKRERENTRGRESVEERERANAEEFKIKYCIKRKK